MNAGWSDIGVSWSIKDFGAPLLDSVSRGMYSQLEVFREYFQNALDAYTRFQRVSGLNPQNLVQVLVDVDNSAVHIMDYGTGMSLDDINIAKKFFVSPKLPYPNEYVGFRGIGIWSGLASCEQIIVVTTKYGDTNEYKVTVDCKGIVEHVHDQIPVDELLDGRLTIEERSATKDDHYTHVKLVNVDKNQYGDLLDIEKMRSYAEEYLPVPFDPAWPYTQKVTDILSNVPFATTYELTINGLPVYRRFPPDSEIKPPEPISVRAKIGERDLEVATGWLCETARRGSQRQSMIRVLSAISLFESRTSRSDPVGCTPMIDT